MAKPSIARLLRLLNQHYPDARCSLNFSDSYQLLVATILSAQCTDKRVNQITPAFFAQFPTPAAVVSASLDEIKAAIRSAGFFNTKAYNIQEACRIIITQHEGNVPSDWESLLALPGVGRKTAHVIRGVWFRLPAMVVDTHVGRIVQRLGLTRETAPEKIEAALRLLLPEASWTKFGHQIIAHGRTICIARKPRCPICPLAALCQFAKSR